MTDRTEKIDDIFWEALQIASSEQRVAFLDQKCGSNAELRELVEKLLRAQPKAEQFLERPIEFSPPTCAPTVTERPGTQIGPYKLLQQIGEGGMGVVYMAEQTEPIARRVALKIIKPGMDSRQVIARFEAERQALSLMDHPNIAKVLDAGTTESGRPYFVMELVKGQPITQYCDEHHLTPRRRLELLLPVCQAIQHAHQKGIIHRDIKPTNILVAEYDQKAVPKVIDFGVAKATSQALTEKTMFTGFGQIVGTLEYMSPEQAKVNQLDIDTRSDIYSLGVLLYELLTGSTPFDKTHLRSAAFDEMLRIIREEEPEKPSTRLSSADTLPSIAANRSMEPARLGRAVRGELDWIVMKALEKDRSRRYETASGLAADLQRYLDDEPVQACPPSAVYRFRKFARRNLRALATSAVAGLALLLAIGVLGWAVRDRGVRAYKAAMDEAARKTNLAGNLQFALERAELFQQEGKRGEAVAALERVELLGREISPEPLVLERIAHVRDRLNAEGKDLAFIARLNEIRGERSQFDAETNRWLHSRAYPVLRTAFAEYGIEINVTPKIHVVGRIQSRPAHVQSQLIAGLHECLVRAPKADVLTRQWLVEVLNLADKDPWRIKFRATFLEERPEAHNRLVRELIREVDVQTQPVSFLVWSTTVLPDRTSSAEIDYRRKIADAYPGDYWANHHCGIALYLAGQAGALNYLTAAIALRPDDPAPYHARANAWAASGYYEAAAADDRRAVALAPRYASAHYKLGLSYLRLGRLGEALDAFTKLVEIDREGWAFEYDAFCGSYADGNVYEHWNLPAAIEEMRRRCQEEPERAEFRGVLSLLLHEFAWELATNPDAAKRDPGRAVTLAKEAVEGMPYRSDFWNTLGVALYRSGQWTEAIAALLKYRESPKTVGDWSNPFFLAMAHWQLGRQDEARDWYERGTAAMADRDFGFAPLVNRFRTEAQNLLGLRNHQQFEGHGETVRAALFFPAGDRALSAGYDRTIRIWDLVGGRQIARFSGHTGSISSAAVSPDGRRVLSSGTDQTMRLWDAATGNELLRIEHPAWAENVAFDHSGRRALSCAANTVYLWDLETGKELMKFEGHTESVRRAAFSPDDRCVFTASHDATLRKWSVATGQEIQRFEGHSRWVLGMAISPDGRRLLSGSIDRTVRLWDADTGGELNCFRGHTFNVESVDFAPDGRRAVSGGGDGTIRVWDLEDGRQLDCIGTDYVFSVDVSPNGRQIISAHMDGHVRLWGVPGDELSPQSKKQVQEQQLVNQDPASPRDERP